MSDQLDAATPVLEIRADPDALAPERLLVFELTGSILAFEKAVALIPGLEFLGSEDLDEDGDEPLDDNPVLYLMVPNEAALRNVVTLWKGWQRDGTVPYGFSAWKVLLSQLRDIRPWGPQDRITPGDRTVLSEEAQHQQTPCRIELELVFRDNGEVTEQQARLAVIGTGGRVVSRTRIPGAGYHALLCDVPAGAITAALTGNTNSLAGQDAVLQIRPQSLLQMVPIDDAPSVGPAPNAPVVAGDPIAAVFDAVPLAAHPRLAGAISVDDQFDLEPMAVGPRRHGTAMASAVVHGDFNAPWPRALQRPVHFVNMLYAPANPDAAEAFPDRLPADMFEEALVRMREGEAATARHVIIVNASLGDANKPFAGRMSGWARVVDYLAAKHGVLFIISAGNHCDYLETLGMTSGQFEDLSAEEKTRVALRASAAQMTARRILAPAESMNAITVGALHDDHFPPGYLSAYVFDVFAQSGLCAVSSGLGPGYGGATKPDILAPGGRHHVQLMAQGANHRLQPLGKNAAAFGGVAVAAPPTSTDLGLDNRARTVGTSVAAALATGVAARAHEALEAAYEDFVTLPGEQRAVLLKALLVHGAKWTQARDLLIEILGPSDNRKHYRQKDNVRRYLGYGAYDPERLIHCADDRATLWATGTLASDQGRRFRIPWPAVMSGKARPHALSATLAWFTPPRPGAVAYRAIRMKIIEPGQLGSAGIKVYGAQPDPKQAHKGTVVHRRWEGSKAAAIAGDGYFDLDVQRENDGLAQSAAFSLVVTLEMEGETAVYSQVYNRVALKPAVRVPG